MLAAIVAVAGTALARAADGLADATGFGRLLVGSVLLVAATSLPELSVDIAAVRARHADIAVGDLLGSSLMNLFILAGIDLCRRNGRKMLSREAASHALSAALGIALTGLAGCAILTAGRIAIETAKKAEPRSVPLWRSLSIFVAAASALVVAGPRLAESADLLADRTDLGGTFVGTTLVALTTSLPELVASLAAVRMGAPDLAVGNVSGSNAFNMILFVTLDAVHSGSFFQEVSPTHAVTAFAIMVATSIAFLGSFTT